MKYLFIALIGLLAGIVGTGGVTPRIRKKPLSFIIEFCGGIMICVVCFYLLPASFDGLSTGIGTLTGSFLGGIAPGLSLCFASGAILYIVFGELVPKAHKLHKGRLGTAGNFVGMIAGVIISFLL